MKSLQSDDVGRRPAATESLASAVPAQAGLLYSLMDSCAPPPRALPARAQRTR